MLLKAKAIRTFLYQHQCFSEKTQTQHRGLLTMRSDVLEFNWKLLRSYCSLQKQETWIRRQQTALYRYMRPPPRFPPLE
jgi:hypothetical protein